MPVDPTLVNNGEIDGLWKEYEQRLEQEKAYLDSGVDIYPEASFVIKTWLHPSAPMPTHLAGGQETPTVEQKPQPKRPAGTIVVKDEGGIKVFINMCYEPSIGAPGQDKDPATGEDRYRIPLSSGPPRAEVDRVGENCLVWDVVFNPATIEKCNSDKEFRNVVAQFAIQNLQVKHKTEFVERVKYPAIKYKGQNGQDTKPMPQRIRKTAAQKVALVEVVKDGEDIGKERSRQDEETRLKPSDVDENDTGSGTAQLKKKKTVTTSASVVDNNRSNSNNVVIDNATPTYSVESDSASGMSAIVTKCTVLCSVFASDYRDNILDSNADVDNDMCLEYVDVDAWFARSDIVHKSSSDKSLSNRPRYIRVLAELPLLQRSKEVVISLRESGRVLVLQSVSIKEQQHQRQMRLERAQRKNDTTAMKALTDSLHEQQCHQYKFGIALPWCVCDQNMEADDGMIEPCTFDSKSHELVMNLQTIADLDKDIAAQISWKDRLQLTNAFIYDLCI